MPKVGETRSRPERLAVNLYDLDRIDPFIRPMLLGGKLDLHTAIKIDKNRFDETAVAFKCDLLSAACICDTLRSHDRSVGDYPSRVYLQRKPASQWIRLSNSAILTEVRDGKIRLSPVVFLSEPPRVVPLEHKAVEL